MGLHACRLQPEEFLTTGQTFLEGSSTGGAAAVGLVRTQTHDDAEI